MSARSRSRRQASSNREFALRAERGQCRVQARANLIVRVKADAAQRRARRQQPVLLPPRRGLVELQTHRHACGCTPCGQVGALVVLRPWARALTSSSAHDIMRRQLPSIKIMSATNQAGTLPTGPRQVGSAYDSAPRPLSTPPWHEGQALCFARQHACQVMRRNPGHLSMTLMVSTGNGEGLTFQAVVPGLVDQPQALPRLERVVLLTEGASRNETVKLGEQLCHACLCRRSGARLLRAGDLRHVSVCRQGSEVREAASRARPRRTIRGRGCVKAGRVSTT